MTLIQQLMTTGKHELSTNFMDTSDQLVAFAAMGAQMASPPGNIPDYFRINGAIYHCDRELHLEYGEARKYLQLYILDSQEAAAQRLKLQENQGCQLGLIQTLSAWMVTHNTCKILYEVKQQNIQNALLYNPVPSTVSMTVIQDLENEP